MQLPGTQSPISDTEVLTWAWEFLSQRETTLPDCDYEQTFLYIVTTSLCLGRHISVESIPHTQALCWFLIWKVPSRGVGEAGARGKLPASHLQPWQHGRSNSSSSQQHLYVISPLQLLLIASWTPSIPAHLVMTPGSTLSSHHNLQASPSK